jgi:hypothetical protein
MAAILAVSPLGIAGLVVLGVALVLLLISVLHPEGRRRPGGYLDGQAPPPGDEDADEPPG